MRVLMPNLEDGGRGGGEVGIYGRGRGEVEFGPD